MQTNSWADRQTVRCSWSACTAISLCEIREQNLKNLYQKEEWRAMKTIAPWFGHTHVYMYLAVRKIDSSAVSSCLLVFFPSFCCFFSSRVPSVFLLSSKLFFFFFFLFIFHLLSLFLSASWLFLSLCIPSCFPSSPCCECVSTMLYRHSLLSHHLVI